MATALAGGALPFFWGQARVVFDRPDKAGADPGDRATHMGPHLREVVERAASEVILVSPYFVPREGGVAFLSGLRQRGVRVRVLTNSLASTDLPVIHTGYAPYREDLLRAGVELYELKPTAHERGRRRLGDSAEPEAPESAAQAGLHAKTFVVDRRIMFVGSFNLDPRSALLNTEMGVLLEIPALAESMADAFEKGLPEQAFRLELRPVQAAAGGADAAGSTLQWVAWEGGQEVRFDAEPFAGFWLRLKVWFLSLLPIEGQL
jgi:putative cardiolipin synthase